jgi:hypothetical protein
MSLQSFIQDFKAHLKETCPPSIETHARNLDGSELNVEQFNKWLRDSHRIQIELMKQGMTPDTGDEHHPAYYNTVEFDKEYGKRIRKLYLVEEREEYDEKYLLSCGFITVEPSWMPLLRQVVMDKEVSAYIEEHPALFPESTLAFCGTLCTLSSRGFENGAMVRLVIQALGRMVLREECAERESVRWTATQIVKYTGKDRSSVSRWLHGNNKRGDHHVYKKNTDGTYTIEMIKLEAFKIR